MSKHKTIIPVQETDLPPDEIAKTIGKRITIFILTFLSGAVLLIISLVNL